MAARCRCSVFGCQEEQVSYWCAPGLLRPYQAGIQALSRLAIERLNAQLLATTSDPERVVSLSPGLAEPWDSTEMRNSPELL